jgi:hypothetical protein
VQAVGKPKTASHERSKWGGWKEGKEKEGRVEGEKGEEGRVKGGKGEGGEGEGALPPHG